MGIRRNALADVIDQLGRCRSKGSIVQIGLISVQVPPTEIFEDLEKSGYCTIDGKMVAVRHNTQRISQLFSEGKVIRSQRTSSGSFVNPELLLLALGFDDIHALDISDHDGADLIGDLNDPELHRRIGRRFGTVVEIGTIEHVFHVPNALWNLVQMCELGGEIVHAAPTNNWPNHGFYQLSPTLFHDYYAANGFEVLESRFMRYPADWRAPVSHAAYRHEPSFRDPIPLDGLRYLFWFRARKTAERDQPVFPQQSAYAAIPGWDPLATTDPAPPAGLTATAAAPSAS